MSKPKPQQPETPRTGPLKVLFVCMGNICRSPTAEGVFANLVAKNDLSDSINTDSAGTHAYHIGESPDSRAQQAATSRGVDLSALRGRQFVANDYREFDYILAMDKANYKNIVACNPGDGKARVSLMMEFAENASEKEVPDPYYGGHSGFEHVLDMIEDASNGLLRHIRRQHDL